MDSSPRLSEPSEPNVASPTPSTSFPIEDSIIAAVPTTTPTPKTAAMGPRKKAHKGKRIVVRRPAAKKSKWTAETILTDPRSPLATADLRSLLSNPAAWDVLDAVERTEILSLFPGGEHVLDARSADARPDILSLRNDDTFRHDCAAYTENVAEGRFDPGWLECAWSAHERRKMGDFDEHLAAKFEEDWQITLPNEYRPRREPSMGEAPAAASGAQARRDESMSEEAVSGHVNASNEHSPKGDDPERSTLHELGVSITASNGTYQSEYEFIEEVEEEQANERDQDDHHQTGEAMAVDELQVDEDVDMTTRPAPTPLARKLHRRTQTGEMDSEDELA